MTFQADAPTVERAVQSTTIQEFINHGKNIAYKSFGFPKSGNYAYYSPQEIGLFAEKAVCHYHSKGISTRKGAADAAVVGLVLSPGIESVVSYLALTRMGHTVLLLAPQLEAEAIQHLAHEANCKIILNAVKDGPGYKSLRLVTLNELAQKENLFWALKCCVLPHQDEPAVIIHSSGTTGQPKLIPKSHRSIMEMLRNTSSALHDKNILVGSWLHWLGGYCMMLFAFVKCGSHVCWPSEDCANSRESAKNIILQTNPDIVVCNSWLLMSAVHDVEALEALKRCSLVTNIGGVLPPAVAGILTQNGVRLTTGYGMSELPLSLSSTANAGDLLFWDYLQIVPSMALHLRFRLLREEEGNTENGNERFYELIILPSLPGMDKKWATDSDGSHHTGDIFIKHPTQESYRCLGRLTDMVRVAPNSTDVIPLHARTYESIIESHCTEIIDAAVLYGDERPSVVILLFVRCSATTLSDERIIDKVWSVIESEAQTAQMASLVELKKAMLVVIRDQKVPRTSKGDVVRAQTFLQFSSFIDSVL
ncbi:hypothetical protein NLG97_g982 [Lecanicillium saksenae]|uniref:Uncharacterized protein n=1 Tax=Lecanicillium saksenae TaxID=468837 RepID=A0ACC1R950_9HYPO|nr:hypothetical protein NLG97_g982 [Lecanicillium saksenae]